MDMQDTLDVKNYGLGGLPIDLLPCPFCGREVDDDLIDTLHPSGTYWRTRKVGKANFTSYHTHAEKQPGDKRCWVMRCTKHSGGCGAQINGDSRKEVCAAWNRRAVPSRPTTEMSIAGMRALRDARRTCTGYESREQAEACWEAMLTACFLPANNCNNPRPERLG